MKEEVKEEVRKEERRKKEEKDKPDSLIKYAEGAKGFVVLQISNMIRHPLFKATLSSCGSPRSNVKGQNK